MMIKAAGQVVKQFNQLFPPSKDDYAPVIITLRQQNNLGQVMDQISQVGGLVVFVFVLSMSLVFWNAGLLGGSEKIYRIRNTACNRRRLFTHLPDNDL